MMRPELVHSPPNQSPDSTADSSKKKMVNSKGDLSDLVNASVGVRSKKLNPLIVGKAAGNVDLLESSKLRASVDFDGPGPQVSQKGEKKVKKEKQDSIKEEGGQPESKKRGAKQRIPRAKKPKDMPRRPLSAYNIFFKSTRMKMMQSPPAGFDGDAVPFTGKIGFETLAKTIGREWKALSAEELEVYKTEAEEDMQRYKREMEDYHQNLAKKRRVALPVVPTASEQFDADALRKDETTARAGLESNLVSGVGISDQLPLSEESSYAARMGVLNHANYGSLAEMMAAAASQQQQSDQHALIQQQQQELANIRRQELFLQQATAMDPLSNTMSNSTLGTNSLLYEHYLAQKLDLIRSQQQALAASSLGQASQFAQSSLYGLQQHQAPSLLEQLILLQQENHRATDLASFQAESARLRNRQADMDAITEAQHRYSTYLGSTGEYLGTNALDGCIDPTSEVGQKHGKGKKRQG